MVLAYIADQNIEQGCLVKLKAGLLFRHEYTVINFSDRETSPE
jgi:hypothetical protein